MALPNGATVCVDVGSTFTKAAAIDPDGAVLATSQHPTTVGTDVLVGLDAAVAALGLGPVRDDRIIACSSAGGGLRLAVVGQERVISESFYGSPSLLAPGLDDYAFSVGAQRRNYGIESDNYGGAQAMALWRRGLSRAAFCFADRFRRSAKAVFPLSF